MIEQALVQRGEYHCQELESAECVVAEHQLLCPIIIANNI